MSIRAIKRQARRVLHWTLAVPVLYLLPTEAPENPHTQGTQEYDDWVLPNPPYFETPIACTARVHTKFDALGDMKGTNYHYAEKQETVPKVIFMRSDIDKPMRGAIISVEIGEAYRIDNVLPPDDITVAAEVTRLKSAESLGLPVPD